MALQMRIWYTGVGLIKVAMVGHLLLAGGADACTIPVFRYALDRWEADKFHLVLPAGAGADAALNDLLRPLRADGKANLSIETSRDADLSAPELRSSRGSTASLWSGALDAASLDRLLSSPARQRIVEHIVAGDSVVWVVADDGTAADDAEAARIEKRLRFLEQVAALPVQDPNDPDSQLGPGPPLRLEFTLLRIRRDDPGEQLLVKMLLGPDGKVDAAKPFAAAVFGRGRVLGAWPVAEIDDMRLEDACMFLIGRCSCRMKNDNPGWDLLLDVDWEKTLKQAASVAVKAADSVMPADAGTVAKSSDPVVETVVTQASNKRAEEKNTISYPIIGVAAAALIFLALALLRSKRV